MEYSKGNWYENMVREFIMVAWYDIAEGLYAA